LLLLAANALPLGACSGGYSLPPTRCDEWCNATKNFTCEEDYDPAGCVTACAEILLGPKGGPCEPEFEAMIACYRAEPRVATSSCHYLKRDVCQVPAGQLGICSGRFP